MAGTGRAGHSEEAEARAAQQDHPPEAAPAAGHDADELVTLAEAARIFGIHPSTFRKYCRSGDAPEPVVLGTRAAGKTAQAFRWWKSELLAYRRDQLPRASETDSSWRSMSPKQKAGGK